MSKKKVKMKKKPFLIIILVLIIIIGGIFLVFKIKNDKEIKLVKSYYHKNIITSKKTNIYNKYKRNIGTVEKNISLLLNIRPSQTHNFLQSRQIILELPMTRMYYHQQSICILKE